MNNWMERLAKEIAAAAVETAKNDGQAPALEFARQDIEERFVDGDITRQEKDELMRLTREHLSSANFGRGGRPKSAHNRDHKYLSAEEHEQTYARARKRIQRYKTERKGKFEEGGVVYRHKWIPTMTFRPTAETKRGWKGIQHDPKSLSRLERNKGKQVSYSLAEMKELWNREVGSSSTSSAARQFKVGGLVGSGLNWAYVFDIAERAAQESNRRLNPDTRDASFQPFAEYFRIAVGNVLSVQSNYEVVDTRFFGTGTKSADKEIHVSHKGFKRGKKAYEGYAIRIPFGAFSEENRIYEKHLLNHFIHQAAVWIPSVSAYSISYLNSKLRETDRPIRGGYLEIGFAFFSQAEYDNYLLPIILSKNEYDYREFLRAKHELVGVETRGNAYELPRIGNLDIYEWQTPAEYASVKKAAKFAKGGIVDAVEVAEDDGIVRLQPAALDVLGAMFEQYNKALTATSRVLVLGGAGMFRSQPQMGLPQIIIQGFSSNEVNNDDLLLNHFGVEELSGVSIRIPNEAVEPLSRTIGARPASVKQIEEAVNRIMEAFPVFVSHAALFYDDNSVSDLMKDAEGLELVFILPTAKELDKLEFTSDMYEDSDINPFWAARPQILANMGLSTTSSQSVYSPSEAMVLLTAQYPLRPSGSDITMFRKGGKVEVEIIEADKNFDEYVYRGVLGDFDGDGTANADDVNPTNPRESAKIEKNTPFAETLGSVLDLKRAMDDKMYNYVDKLKSLTPENGKIIARTKTPYSILKKLVMKRLTDKRRGLTDLIGGTILADNRRQLEAIMDKVRNGALGEVVEIEDMYAKPKNGYRAYHLLVDFEGTIVELQLKTKRQKAINELTHAPYKAGKLNAPLMLEMTSVAAAADEGDAEAQGEFARFMRQPNLDKVFWVD